MQPAGQFSPERIKAHILLKLIRKRRWGGRHTELANVRGSLPAHLAGEAEKAARELCNEGLITWLKKTNQVHVSLNSHRRKEITEMVKRYYPGVAF